MKTYWILFANDYAREFDEITFCSESLSEALKLFYAWHLEEFGQKIPVIKNVEQIYNKDDHDYYGEQHEQPLKGGLTQ